MKNGLGRRVHKGILFPRAYWRNLIGAPFMHGESGKSHRCCLLHNGDKRQALLEDNPKVQCGKF